MLGHLSAVKKAISPALQGRKLIYAKSEDALINKSAKLLNISVGTVPRIIKCSKTQINCVENRNRGEEADKYFILYYLVCKIQSSKPNQNVMTVFGNKEYIYWYKQKLLIEISDINGPHNTCLL